MQGLMSDQPMLLIDVLRHGAQVHADAKIISVASGKKTHSYTYQEALGRTAKLATALGLAGCVPGTVVATLAWNSHRHVEIYYATAGIGAICHTINPRLSGHQIGDLIEQADDKFLFVEVDLLDLISPLISRPGFPQIIVLEAYPEHDIPDVGDTPKALAPSGYQKYEAFLNAAPALAHWPTFDERTASSLCYTSGTTGRSKGVLYSHRSSVLHAMSICRTDTWAVSGDDVICSFAPMFHVNAWGLPFAAPLCGADLILPGPHLGAAAIYQMIEDQNVTLAFAVPTLWHDVLAHMERFDLTFSTLKRVVVSGSSISKEMISMFEERLGVEVMHVWGMTESSPMGLVNRLSRRMKQLPKDVLDDLKLRQGRPVFGTEVCLLNLEDDARAADGMPGEIAIRGPWTASSYYRGDAASQTPFIADGWFRTGDVATRDAFGFYQIVDRRKDAIKSGGEWISSLALEQAAQASDQVVSVAAVGMPHAKWGERPVLAVVARNRSTFDEQALLAAVGRVVQKWAVPDYVVLLDSLPMTSTGKMNKDEIRRQLKVLIAANSQ